MEGKAETAEIVEVASDGDEEEEGMYPLLVRMRYRKQAKARNFIVETLLYGVFMMVFCLVTYTLRPAWTYYMTDSVRGAVLRTTWEVDKDFTGIGNVQDVFNWGEKVLLPTLYPTQWYNGEDFNVTERKFAIWYNFLLGRMRWRQVRVQRGLPGSATCIITERFRHAVDFCYPEFSTADHVQETAPYGGEALEDPTMGKAFRWSSATDTCTVDDARYCTSFVYGKRGTRYPSDGYVWDFSSNFDTAVQELKSLRDLRWVDIQTRAIIVDFTVYNPGIRMICAVELVIEFFPTGELAVTESIKPMNLLSLSEPVDVIIFTGEVVLIVAVAAYLGWEVYEFYRFWKVGDRCTHCRKAKAVREGEERLLPCIDATCPRQFNAFRIPNCPRCGREVPTSHMCWRGYFQDSWNWIDLVNQVFFISVFVTRILLRADITKVDYDVGNEFFNFYPLAWRYSFANWLNSVNALLCFTKTFKYLGKFKALSTLVRTIATARNELLFFFIIFFLVFLGFSLSFHLAFGTDMMEFNDWAASSIALFLMLLGSFDYPSLQSSNRVLGPLFFMSYTLLVFYILANMFIAIISGAHNAAKHDIATSRDDFLSASLRIYFTEWRRRLRDSLGGHSSRAVNQVRRIGKQLLQADLQPQECDDVRIFLTEVDRQPDNNDLFHTLLREFYFDVDREMDRRDYHRLKRAVIAWRLAQKKSKMRMRVWDEDSEEEEEDDEEIQRQRVIARGSQIPNPDPDVKPAAIFARMRNPRYGLLQNHRKIWRLQNYPNCFTGRRGVDWVLKEVYPGKQVAREKALELLQYWGRRGWIDHVSGDHPFQDTNDLLYKITVTDAMLEQEMTLMRKVSAQGAWQGLSGLVNATARMQSRRSTIGMSSTPERIRDMESKMKVLLATLEKVQTAVGATQ